MRWSWIVLAAVVAAGLIAFLSSRDSADDHAPKGDATNGDVALKREIAVEKASPTSRPDEVARERGAKELIQSIASARTAGKKDKVAEYEARLRKQSWNTFTARRYALRQGTNMLAEVRELDGVKRVQRAHDARVLLSRAVYLPEMFDKQRKPTARRANLIQRIEELNQIVMRYRDGLPGVTVPYEVAPGMSPVRIVSRKKLRCGHNAILKWVIPSLDPRKLRAGQLLQLPQEELTIEVHKTLFLLGVFVGDWFVTEYPVGHGRKGKPTPEGVFTVHSKDRNPDWWAPDGDGGTRRIPAGHPENELGAVWIALEGGRLTRSDGIGIHGTNKPETVGTKCSNGCVRLANSDAKEVFWWVRTGSKGGQPTRIKISRW